jgi:Escherichia/Staphylococcus phage prohead protease
MWLANLFTPALAERHARISSEGSRLLLYKSTPLELVEIKAGDSGMQFTAYASTFGNTDHGGDIVEKGAFADSLKSRPFRPLLWQHNMSEPIGIEKTLKEDSKGLLGTWQLVDTTRGQEAYKLLKAGAVRSMSIGYIPTKWEFEDTGDGPMDTTRRLKAVDLLENSVVSLPMNEEATVQNVKHLAFCASCMEAIDAVDAALKATWTTAYVNALPDSAFALVYTDDAGNKQRKLPHHNADGAVDLPHLRNALARAPQMTGVSDAQRSKAIAHLDSHASAAGVGKEDDEVATDDANHLANLSTAELARLIAQAADLFGERTKSLLEKLTVGDFALTDTKRHDLQAFLETFSGIDAVRHDAEAVLSHEPTNVIQSALALAIARRKAQARRHGIEV